MRSKPVINLELNISTRACEREDRAADKGRCPLVGSGRVCENGMEPAVVRNRRVGSRDITRRTRHTTTTTLSYIVGVEPRHYVQLCPKIRNEPSGFMPRVHFRPAVVAEAYPFQMTAPGA